MEIFFHELLNTLDRLRPKWRKDHIFLLDNATYHKSKKMLAFFKENNAKVLYTGSYSYNAAPIELLFAAFKSADINPRHVPQSKK